MSNANSSKSSFMTSGCMLSPCVFQLLAESNVPGCSDSRSLRLCLSLVSVESVALPGPRPFGLQCSFSSSFCYVCSMESDDAPRGVVLDAGLVACLQHLLHDFRRFKNWSSLASFFLVALHVHPVSTPLNIVRYSPCFCR